MVLKVKKNISILIPAYNESAVLEMLYQQLVTVSKHINEKYNIQFFFVDDGSSDDTLAIIRKLSENDDRISYRSLSRNFGKEIAMTAGLDALKDSDAVVIMDADLQDPPEIISEMIKYWEQGYDDVYAKRRSRDGETWLKRKTSEVFYRILQKSTKIKIQQDTGDFRLLSQRCVRALVNMRESQRYTKGMFSWVGYKKKEIVYDRKRRAAGKTKWNYRQLTNLAIEGITSFTTAPLRVASLFGFVVSGLAFTYISYLLLRPLFGVSTGGGYSSLMAVILFLGGVQLICVGILGEYTGRIFNEVKKRPLYFVDEDYRGKK